MESERAALAMIRASKSPKPGARLLLEGGALAAEKARARDLPKVPITSRETGDLIMMGIGGFTPLTGFMTKADWKAVCDKCLLADGTFWPVRIDMLHRWQQALE